MRLCASPTDFVAGHPELIETISDQGLQRLRVAGHPDPASAGPEDRTSPHAGAAPAKHKPRASPEVPGFFATRQGPCGRGVGSDSAHASAVVAPCPVGRVGVSVYSFSKGDPAGVQEHPLPEHARRPVTLPSVITQQSANLQYNSTFVFVHLLIPSIQVLRQRAAI